MEANNNPTFVLKKLMPVGIKVIKYPVANCGICRRKLVTTCLVCVIAGVIDKECQVERIDDECYVHSHCYAPFKGSNIQI